MDRALLLDMVVFLAVMLGLPYLAIRAFHFIRENFCPK